MFYVPIMFIFIYGTFIQCPDIVCESEKDAWHPPRPRPLLLLNQTRNLSYTQYRPNLLLIPHPHHHTRRPRRRPRRLQTLNQIPTLSLHTRRRKFFNSAQPLRHLRHPYPRHPSPHFSTHHLLAITTTNPPMKTNA